MPHLMAGAERFAGSTSAPTMASLELWWLWVVSWGLAAVWSRRTAARASYPEQVAHRIPTAIGGILLLYGGWTGGFGVGAGQLWALPDLVSWPLTGVVLLGLGFCWWARLTLGDLWSGSITRKEGHRIVERGPYGLVRHPIYTGMILAAFAYALQAAHAANLIGAAILTLGFAFKARMEENFLASQLGEAAYADYRRRTPMLVPFLRPQG